MSRLHARYGCPVSLAIDVLGGKWRVVLLARLKEEPQRYSELRRRVPRMSEKMLTQRLAELTEEGLVARRRAVYALTARGRSAQPVLEALYAWGEAVAPQLGVTIAPPPERRAITARSASASDRGPSRR